VLLPTKTLRNLKRQFGKRLVEVALKSPTLIDDIKRIKSEGVKIRQVDGPCRAYYDRRKRTIYIGRWCPRNYKLISIAHEFVHALVRPTIDPIAGETGRQEFVERCLEEETEAIVHEIRIVKELLKAGVKVDPKELEWLNRYKRGGRRAIRRALEKTITSTTGEDYPEYYGSWYDEIIPQAKRLP
jgi:Zn-dependent peptidase ImmA (M78 family)